MWYPLEQQIIRTVMALCALSAHDTEIGVREDARDEAAALVYLWIQCAGQRANGTDPASHMRTWCERTAQRLEALSGDAARPRDEVLAAHTCVLRLHAALVDQGLGVPARKAPPVPAPVPVSSQALRDPGKNHAKVLQFIRERLQVRPSELMERFSGTLSDRTIKRCLRDLVAAGTLTRIEEDRAVVYRADS